MSLSSLVWPAATNRGGRGRLAATWATPASAVNIVVDYAYDTNNFFADPAGSQARPAIEATASFYSGILTDTFSSISKPPDFHSTVFNGVATWDWTLEFSNPSGAAMSSCRIKQSRRMNIGFMSVHGTFRIDAWHWRTWRLSSFANGGGSFTPERIIKAFKSTPTLRTP